MRNKREDRYDKQKRQEEEKKAELNAWKPKTELGKKVKNEEITSIDEIFEKGQRILEPEIVDTLLPEMEEELIDFKKTTKVRRSGRMFAFRASVLVGDKNKYIGIGTAKDKERWPAIRKATRQAKLNLVHVRKGSGAWETTATTGASVPFKVKGKSSSVKIELIPAPEGTGLVVGSKIRSVMKFAGIKDVWSKSFGNTGSSLDFAKAAINALANTTKMKLSQDVQNKTTREK
jgi:small subunit ribosomal protein S5